MRETIEKHIKEHIKEYIILFLILLLGIIVGIITANNIEDGQKNEISNYLTNFIENLKNTNTINYESLLINLIKDNSKLLAIIAFLSLSIFGAIGVYTIIGYKGFCIGYSISSVIATLGIGKGLLISIILVLLSKLISIPFIFYLSIESLKLYKVIINNLPKEEIKAQIIKYVITMIIVFIALTISALVETYINSNLLLNVIKYV